MLVNEHDLPPDLPKLPNGWTSAPLGQLVDARRGISYGIVQPGSNTPGGVPIVRVNNLKNHRVVTDDVMEVSRDIERNYERTRLRGGEVLLSLVGSLGESAIAPSALSGWNTARAVAVIPVLDDPGPNWVGLCLRSPVVQHYIRTWATTTVQATLNLRDVVKLPIPLPPHGERNAISEVLLALDDKLELNRQVNETLEAMAWVIFKSWFVDFDPVRTKAQGRQPFGMNAATAAFFPDSFQDSSLGKIPKGWHAGSIGKLVSLSREAVNPGDSPNEIFDHYSIPAFDEGGWPKEERGEQIKSNKFLILGDFVLLSKLNPRIPRVWLPVLGNRRSVASTEFLVASPREGFSRAYVLPFSGPRHSLMYLRLWSQGLPAAINGSHQNRSWGWKP